MDRPGTVDDVAPSRTGEETPRLAWYTRAKFELVRSFLTTWMWCFGLTGLYRFGRLFGTCEDRKSVV